MNVLNALLRRKGPSDGLKTGEQQKNASAQSSQQAPTPGKRTTGKSDDGTSDLTGELYTARRASQVNLNRYLASAPLGLTAVLKQPSRGGDLLLDPSTYPGRGSSPNNESPPGPSQPPQAGQPPQPPEGSQDVACEPSVRGRPMRERRKSVSLAEMAQGVHNVDVSQAALIMMPARLKAELGSAGAVGAGAASNPQLPVISRSAGFPVGTFSSSLSGSAQAADTPANASSPGGLGSGAALAAARGYDRKPSLLREAMKQQQQQQQGVAKGPQPDTSVRGHTANFTGDLGLMQLASALAGQGPDRAPVPRGGQAPDRRSSTLLLTQQQAHAPANRVSVNDGHGIAVPAAVVAGQPPAAATLPGPPAAPHGVARRSDPGDGFRSRTAGPAPIDVVINNVRGGLNRPKGAGTDEGAGAPASNITGAGAPQSPGAGPYMGGTKSNKELRAAGSGVLESEGQWPGSSAAHGSLSGDLRLPRVAGAGLGSARRERDREQSAGSGVAVARPSVSPAEVAAISEAMAAYQSEAGRLRAAALRKVDTKIKRAVMERYLGPEPEFPQGLGGAHDSNALTPTLRSQPLVKTRMSITPPPQQPKSARMRQRPDSHRQAASSGSSRSCPQDVPVGGAAEESSQLLPRNGIGGPRVP